MTWRKWSSWLAVAVLAAGCGRFLPADSSRPDGRLLSYEELHREFASMDANHDGYVTLREYSLWPDPDAQADGYRKGDYTARIDLNGDGRTPWNEYYDARRRDSQTL